MTPTKTSNFNYYFSLAAFPMTQLTSRQERTWWSESVWSLPIHSQSWRSNNASNLWLQFHVSSLISLNPVLTNPSLISQHQSTPTHSTNEQSIWLHLLVSNDYFLDDSVTHGTVNSMMLNTPTQSLGLSTQSHLPSPVPANLSSNPAHSLFQWLN